MTVESDFRFYPVGHGLFYAGRINRGNDYLTFVYDCGSKWDTNLLDAAIERNVDFMACTQKLDYLFISHLHCDHISGISNLISSFPNGVRALIMPYVSFAEYIAGMDMLKDSKDEDFDPILNFVENIGYLLKEKIEYLIVVGSRESAPEENGGIETQDNELRVLGFQNLQLDESLTDEFYKNYPRLLSLSKKIRIVRQGSRIERHDVSWKFQWYVHPLNEEEIQVFQDKIMEIPEFKEYSMGQDAKELLKNLFGGNSAGKKGKSLDQLKKCYESLPIVKTGGHNATSLVLVHRPMQIWVEEAGWIQADQISRMRGGLSTIREIPSLNYYGYLFAKTGTVLFGDINLASDDFKSIVQYFKSEWQHIIIATVPHHGSIKNWNENIFDFLHGVFWIASSRYIDGYHHPDGAVVYNIIKKSPIETFIWNHEGNKVEIHWRHWG